MNQIPFEQLMERAKTAFDSDFFTATPQWAQNHITRFIESDCVINRKDRSGRYNLVRSIIEVEKTNSKFNRDLEIKRENATTRRTGKTARNKAKAGYNCPCVTKGGAQTGHSSKRDHDVAIRQSMRTSKGGK